MNLLCEISFYLSDRQQLKTDKCCRTTQDTAKAVYTSHWFEPSSGSQKKALAKASAFFNEAHLAVHEK